MSSSKKEESVRPEAGKAIEHYLNLSGWQTTRVQQAATHLKFTIAMDKPMPRLCQKDSGCMLVWPPRKYGSKIVHFRDLPMHNEYVDLEARISRFQCRNCKTVSDALLGSDFDNRHHMTKRLITYVTQQAIKRNFSDVGRDVGLSEATVRLLFKENDPIPTVLTEMEPPRVLGIDDKYINGKQCTVFVDLEKRVLLDIHDNANIGSLASFVRNFQGREEQIQLVCQDMSPVYKSFSEKNLSWALVVIDKFHVIMKANEAVDSVRIKVQKSLNDEEKQQLKKLRKAFLGKHPPKKIKHRITKWLSAYPDLGKAWKAKEQFHGFYNQKNRESAERFFEAWESGLDDDTRDDFKDLITCYNNHRKNILNYFQVADKSIYSTITNGFLEGLNLRIEMMSRMAPKYQFKTIRSKMLQAYGPDNYKRPKFSRTGERKPRCLESRKRKVRLKRSASPNPPTQGVKPAPPLGTAQGFFEFYSVRNTRQRKPK